MKRHVRDFLAAARFLSRIEDAVYADWMGACDALGNVHATEASEAYFFALMHPSDEEREAYRHGPAFWGRCFDDAPPKNRDFRILMLCMAAAVAARERHPVFFPQNDRSARGE